MADERILGGSAFVEEILREAEKHATAEDRSRRRSLALNTLVQRVGKSLGLSPEAISGRSRVRRALQGRHLVAYLWVERLGRTASELARSWGWSRGQVTWAAKRGEQVARVWDQEVEEWCR
jgi:chromosomal replication initiation ATPase DnaA